MRDRELYVRILGIEAPWRREGVCDVRSVGVMGVGTTRGSG